MQQAAAGRAAVEAVNQSTSDLSRSTLKNIYANAVVSQTLSVWH
jgi:hypothetical protein